LWLLSLLGIPVLKSCQQVLSLLVWLACEKGLFQLDVFLLRLPFPNLGADDESVPLWGRAGLQGLEVTGCVFYCHLSCAHRLVSLSVKLYQFLVCRVLDDTLQNLSVQTLETRTWVSGANRTSKLRLQLTPVIHHEPR
jgi:hypothetical protein